ncbi:hypothetical protein M758_UG056300 [Ceratodon purpureus]|nr:hypothetical protein M758_UG056300 [Ceratodon purpureus]
MEIDGGCVDVTLNRAQAPDQNQKEQHEPEDNEHNGYEVEGNTEDGPRSDGDENAEDKEVGADEGDDGSEKEDDAANEGDDGDNEDDRDVDKVEPITDDFEDEAENENYEEGENQSEFDENTVGVIQTINLNGEGSDSLEKIENKRRKVSEQNESFLNACSQRNINPNSTGRRIPMEAEKIQKVRSDTDEDDDDMYVPSGRKPAVHTDQKEMVGASTNESTGPEPLTEL